MSVRALPVYPLRDMPAALRQLANRIEHGELEVRNALVILDGQPLTYSVFGEDITVAHGIGLLRMAQDAILESVA